MKEIFIPAIFAAALCLAACGKKETPKVSMPPTPATLVEAVGKTVPSYISTLGTTASLQSVNIVPQVSGQIVSINFKQGDMVKAGQILAVVDKRPYEAAVKQAEGNLLQARAQLKIDELQVERNRKLAKDNYVDKQTFDSLLAKVEIDKGISPAILEVDMQSMLKDVKEYDDIYLTMKEDLVSLFLAEGRDRE